MTLKHKDEISREVPFASIMQMEYRRAISGLGGGLTYAPVYLMVIGSRVGYKLLILKGLINAKVF